MVTKKLFALASVSALAGLMTTVAAAGCSSTTTETTTTDAGGDAKEGGSRRDVEAEEEAPPEDCPQNVAVTVADFDKEIGWKAAVAAPGACAQEDVTQLEANFKDTNIQSYFDLGTGLSAECKACVFSKDTDANWQPIVGTAADNGQTGFVNFGACFGSIEGDACGKALQYEQFCYNVACNECATTQTERQSCIGKAGDTGGMCEEFGATTGTACPQLQDTATQCNSVLDAVKTLCGDGGGSDAGTD